MFGEEDPFASMGAGDTGVNFQTGGASPKPQGQPPAFGGGAGGKEKATYNIINMFWLVNPKAYSGEAYLTNEVHFVTISYNINFGNLRIEVCNMSNESIKDQLICLNKIQKLTNGTVYPSAMFQLVCKIPEVICYEQIINYDGSDWQNKVNPVKFVTTEKGSIVMAIGQHVYEFAGWQKEALLYACKFALKEGMMLSGEATFKK
jgi:hypothetical protein